MTGWSTNEKVLTLKDEIIEKLQSVDTNTMTHAWYWISWHMSIEKEIEEKDSSFVLDKETIDILRSRPERFENYKKTKERYIQSLERRLQSAKNELKMLEEHTLAQRLFETRNTEWELFAKVTEILGYSHPDDSGDELINCGWNDYDCSVRIERKSGLDYITREQADRILDLGFHKILETVGEYCKIWTRGQDTITISTKHPNAKNDAENTITHQNKQYFDIWWANNCNTIIKQLYNDI